MQWLRLYTEVLDDPKVQRLSGDLFKGWVNVLCLARKYGGAIPRNSDDVSFALRLPLRDVLALMRNLHEAGLLEKTEHGWVPHNWDGRQFKSDHDGAERARRHRQKHRNVTGNVTRNGPEQNRTESDTDSISPPLSPPQGVKPKTAVKRATQLPDDWKPTGMELVFAEDLLGSAAAVDREAATMRDWARSKGVTRKDWSATWRNWIRKAADDRQTPRTVNGSGKTQQHPSRAASDAGMVEAFGGRKSRGVEPS